MNEAGELQAPKAPNNVWIVLRRVLAGIVILIAIIGFVVNATGFIGVWFVRGSARDTVTTLSAFVNDKFGIVDQTLARVGRRADEVRQALAHIDNAANAVGDRFEQGSPLTATLTDAVRDELAPKIAEMRTQAAALHDGALSVNAALGTLDSFPFIKIPSFSDELSAISGRVDAARSDIQELRATIEQARTAAPANFIAALATRTSKIDNVMAQIKSTSTKYQSVVVQKRQQITDLSRRMLRAVNLLVVSLTTLFLVGATGQALLIYAACQYARRGKFPVLRMT